MNLLSWVKGLFSIKRKKVTYVTLRQKIRQYNKKEHIEYKKLTKEKGSLDKKYSKYF